MVAFFKKEIAKTYEPSNNEKALAYRQMLIHAVHQCAVKFPDTAAEVVDVLMEFLTDANNTSAIDVVTFVREVVERNDQLRARIVRKLLAAWRSGNLAQIERDVLLPTASQDPRSYQRLFVQRNQQWLPKLQALFGNDSTELVLVGTGHLAGDQGIIAMLRAQGVIVTQLETSND